MLKTFKYKLLPTTEQAEWFDRLFMAGRLIYNIALETKQRAWTSARINLTRFDLNKQLTELKIDAPWLKEFPAQPLESEIAHMDSAYKHFFNGGGFPKFKNRFGRQSATFRQNSAVVGNSIRLSKIGFIAFVKHRELPAGEIRTVVVCREPAGDFFVSILIQDGLEYPEKVPVIEDKTIGVDVGLKSFAALSSGQTIDNPKYFHEELKRLRIQQRKLARRFRNGQIEQSKSYQKQKLVVAKLHDKIANKRKDFLHKLSHIIVSQNDCICIEDLNVAGMMKNHTLAKAISDVSWSSFVRFLEYKANWTGKNLIKIGRFAPSSKMCSNCGKINGGLALSHREWTCDSCGVLHDRDLNAAINIKNLGLQSHSAAEPEHTQYINSLKDGKEYKI